MVTLEYPYIIIENPQDALDVLMFVLAIDAEKVFKRLKKVKKIIFPLMSIKKCPI